MIRTFALLTCVFLAGCAVPTETSAPTDAAAQSTAPLTPALAARNFTSVVQRVEPVAERECRRRTPQQDCDLLIRIDRRSGQPPGAFQTRNDKGQPLIVFTIALIMDARNQDELAFILGHEAAHHIAGHFERTVANAQVGALLLGSLELARGGTPAEVRRAAELGQAFGARRFSKDFELEADELGTIIALRAGFDPVRGSQFFNRVPDPGDEFLGTHPPNAVRLARVREVARQNR